MLGEMLENVREKNPLIHNMTNYVTVNDCANVTLACGASPIMADALEEVAEITSICASLNINMGTLNSRKVKSMFIAGKKANELHHPIVLDPVGVGASTWRRQVAFKFLDEIQFSVIRGNISEIKTLILEKGITKGVDALSNDKVTKENMKEVVRFAQEFSRKTGAIIVITGAIDLVCSKEKAFMIENGHAMMSSVTGTGCQLSALIAAFISVNPHQLLEATLAALCTMGLAGELAFKRLTPLDGNASYRNYIIDAIDHMTPKQLNEGARFQEIIV